MNRKYLRIFLRTAGVKHSYHGYHLSNMNNHHPNISRHANKNDLKRLGGEKGVELFTESYLKTLMLST